MKFNDKKDAVRLTVHIKEGDPLRIADVRLRGFDSLPKASRAALDRAVTFHAGEPRNRQLVMQAQESGVTALKEQETLRKGRRPEEPGPSPRTVIVTLDATPGRQGTFGEVEIQGNQRVADNIIRRQLSIRPGAPFRLSRIQESQQRLQSIPLFSFVYGSRAVVKNSRRRYPCVSRLPRRRFNT